MVLNFICTVFIVFLYFEKKDPIIITRNYFVSYLLLIFNIKVILEVHHDTNIEYKISK